MRTDIIRDLVKEGVLGPEEYSIDCNVDCWPVFKPDALPPELLEMYDAETLYIYWRGENY